MMLVDFPRPALKAILRELEPEFINRQQAAFFDCEAPEVLYSGAFRAGKSRIGCEKAYWLAKRYPGIPIGIFRKTAASLAAYAAQRPRQPRPGASRRYRRRHPSAEPARSAAAARIPSRAAHRPGSA